MKGNFIFYRIIIIGMVAEVLTVLLKLTNVFDFSWWYTLLPIAITDIIFIVTFVILYLYYSHKDKVAQKLSNKES